ncbi:unnamed protein product, partial [Oppiella nova]
MKSFWLTGKQEVTSPISFLSDSSKMSPKSEELSFESMEVSLNGSNRFKSVQYS